MPWAKKRNARVSGQFPVATRKPFFHSSGATGLSRDKLAPFVAVLAVRLPVPGSRSELHIKDTKLDLRSSTTAALQVHLTVYIPRRACRVANATPITALTAAPIGNHAQ